MIFLQVFLHNFNENVDVWKGFGLFFEDEMTYFVWHLHSDNGVFFDKIDLDFLDKAEW